MIAAVRTGSVAPGRMREAVTFAKQIATYFKDTYEVEMEVMLPVGGNPNRIAWAVRYDSLAAMEAVMAKTMADADYASLVAEGIDNFLPGSMNDVIWRTV